MASTKSTTTSIHAARAGVYLGSNNINQLNRSDDLHLPEKRAARSTRASRGERAGRAARAASDFQFTKQVIVIFFLSIGIFIFFPPSFCHLVPSEYLGLELL